VVAQIGVLSAEPQLRRAVLGPAVDEAGVEGDGEGMLGMLEAEVGVDVLPVFGGQQGVGPDEVHLGLRPDDVGYYAGPVLVGVDLGKQVLYRLLDKEM
jgi:hypothetical protein